MPKAAHITVKGGHVFVETPFDEDFVNELKSQSTTRWWDQDNKRWVLDIREKGLACRLVKKHFPDISAYLLEGVAICNLHTGWLD